MDLEVVLRRRGGLLGMWTAFIMNCDGASGCEFGAETTCDDAIDNDADGLADCNARRLMRTC